MDGALLTADMVSDGLRNIMQRHDTLSGLSKSFAKLSPLVDRKQPVHDKAATAKLVEKQKNSPGQPVPIDGRSRASSFLARNPELKSNAVVIPTPAVLISLVLSPPDTEWCAAVDRISLSGTILSRKLNGSWCAGSGESDFADRPQAERPSRYGRHNRWPAFPVLEGVNTMQYV